LKAHHGDDRAERDRDQDVGDSGKTGEAGYS